MADAFGAVERPPAAVKQRALVTFASRTRATPSTMGIKGLFPFLREKAPAAIKERSLKDYLGRTLAIDASMLLYHFLEP